MFKYSSIDVPIFKDKTFKGILGSIILAIVCGGVLGIINLLLGMSQHKLSPSFSSMYLITALRAGVSEEIAFRLFMFAICVYLLKDNPKLKIENFLCYIIMVIPHVLLHFSDMIATTSINSIIGSVIVLSLLFGLLFALLQRKRDLFSAIAAHTLVDLIRFICLGI
ncbi:CPBP family glutamic-type intramembrane protease [Clostridium sp. Marseille-QA1073]